MQLVNQVESWNLCQYPAPTKGVFTCANHTFVFQVWLFMKVVLCTMCWCAGELSISSGTSRNTIKAETWRTRTARTITCGCLSHTQIQSLTHTHKPPDWSHRLDAPFASSLCAWPWPLTSPRMSKAQVSRSLGSRQFDIKLNSFRDQSKQPLWEWLTSGRGLRVGRSLTWKAL